MRNYLSLGSALMVGIVVGKQKEEVPYPLLKHASSKQEIAQYKLQPTQQVYESHKKGDVNSRNDLGKDGHVKKNKKSSSEVTSHCSKSPANKIVKFSPLSCWISRE